MRRRTVRWRASAAIVSGLALTATAFPFVASTAAPAGPEEPADLWTPVSAQRADSVPAGAKRRVEPKEYTAYTLDDAVLDDVLSDAPREDSDARGALLSLPAPSGELVEFRVVDSPIMEAGLAAAHPEITTYAGTAVDSAASLRLDVTPMGLHASVRSPGEGAWFIDPAFNGDDSVYLSYLGTDLPATQRGLVEPDEMVDEHLHEMKKLDRDSLAGEAPGERVQRRTYRLALVTDPSYARYFGTENVLAEKVTLMNRVNQIYNDDLAVRMILIDDTDKLNIDTDAKAWGPDGPCGSAGCYTVNQFANGCTSGLLTRNRIALGQLVGASAYDVGHIALGINGGGIAGLGVVGGDGKARGCTGLPQPEGDFMAIDYVAHEIGHQFSGNHTFNGNQHNCGGNKAAPSVEPGSGSSVMAYAGICRQDDLQPHTDSYFSQWSQQEMTAYITSSRAAINEVQTVGLTGFDDVDAFTLTFRGATTEPIVRGTNYTTAGIKAAIEAILGGPTVTVAAFGGSGQLNDTGFQVTFNNGDLMRTDVEPLVVTPTTGELTALVGETAAGGPIQNGGQLIEETSNHAPVVTAPATATIPLRTPFELTGEATDPDGDDLVYIWEQSDRGAGTGTSLVSQTKTNGPLFRVFGTYADVTPAGTLQLNSPGQNVATSDPTRTFPDIEQILVNNTNAETGLCPEPPAAPTSGGSNVPVPTRDCFSEWMPTVDYVGSTQAGNNAPLALNFRLTARDQKPGGGGYAFANTKVLIDNTAGPFLVDSKNTPAAAVAGRTEVVSWKVNGTNKPELAENVKISLSTDGGRSYPIVLAESTPNDGSEPVTWPNVATKTARIKIEAVGNVFFDVNNADFQIVPKFTVTDALDADVAAQNGAAITPVVVAAAESGSATADEIVAKATGLPQGLKLVAEELSAADALPGRARWTLEGTPADAAGTYPVEVSIHDGSSAAPVVVSFDVTLTGVVPTAPTSPATPDTTSPDTAITAGPADGSIWLSRSATFAVSSEAGATIACTLDGAATDCGAPVSLTPGTHVFTAAAKDASGNVDATPATVRFTVPRNDRALKASGPWKRAKAPKAYLGTVTKVSKKGATLSTRVTGATRLALVVSTAPKAGKVVVKIGGKRVGTVNLKGKKRTQKVVQLKQLTAPRSGKVTIVTKNGKRVVVEGLAVVTAP